MKTTKILLEINLIQKIRYRYNSYKTEPSLQNLNDFVVEKNLEKQLSKRQLHDIIPTSKLLKDWLVIKSIHLAIESRALYTGTIIKTFGFVIDTSRLI